TLRIYGQTDSQYCRAGKVVANLRCVVQLHTRMTRQGFDPTCSVASGTRTSDVGSGQGGSSAEHMQASQASTNTMTRSSTAWLNAALLPCCWGSGIASVCSRCNSSQL